jgi:hypothetical protein
MRPSNADKALRFAARDAALEEILDESKGVPERLSLMITKECLQSSSASSLDPTWTSPPHTCSSQ